MKKRECVCDCEDTLERIEQRLDEIEEHLNNREADYDGNDYDCLLYTSDAADE